MPGRFVREDDLHLAAHRLFSPESQVYVGEFPPQLQKVPSSALLALCHRTGSCVKISILQRPSVARAALIGAPITRDWLDTAFLFLSGAPPNLAALSASLRFS